MGAGSWEWGVGQRMPRWRVPTIPLSGNQLSSSIRLLEVVMLIEVAVLLRIIYHYLQMKLVVSF
ncbi:MAG TPA: hypothetical protein DEG17_13895 [Cyanobacteria bacterium UBA11149]|nr:hypothetical protein [Cyanobacteria bacterium UBA11367]HBE56027.1 hypothetical protein [Cyanobacteria bacterium UBA11366]HBK62625.1 hypothetical protein [Cyanobacteria bacterium UBA11166]HBR76948.1 hypothetical protein [Cyanobacteria bacterium UBA11159]HBS69878.1 hypothetical protein [Cyanobacteria bacterium UBA11153]HBW89931.1 hypothetical protein [Cyanobacteria bacterium UBA11149]HCA95186.1 hypothetical protein [Cyanobacteria bacterium UBA9226]